MHVDAVPSAAPASAHDRYVGRTRSRGEELPKLGRASMAENGAIAARQNGGHPPAFIAYGGVADCVDATVDVVEAGGNDPARDRASRKPGGD